MASGYTPQAFQTAFLFFPCDIGSHRAYFLNMVLVHIPSVFELLSSFCPHKLCPLSHLGASHPPCPHSFYSTGRGSILALIDPQSSNMSPEFGVRSLDLGPRFFTVYHGNFVSFLYKCVPQFFHLSNGDNASSGQGVWERTKYHEKRSFLLSL